MRAAIASLGLFALAGIARASNPTSTYVVPSEVQFFPDEPSATKVVIYGAFFFLIANFDYTDPSCGYMSFSCVPGQEAMCRMQWSEINKAIGRPGCQGFGLWNAKTASTLHDEGTPPVLVQPDRWELGMGVSGGAWVGGKCEPAQKLQCKGPFSNGPDLSSGFDDDGGAPLPVVDMARPAADLSSGPVFQLQPKLASGCAVGGRRGDGLAGLALLMIVLRVSRSRPPVPRASPRPGP